jgi:sugar-specific transcriptional regulator TrmB
MLLNQKQAQISQLKLESQSVIKSLCKKARYKTSLEKPSSQFIVISGRAIIIERIKKTVNTTQISIDTVTTQKRFSQAIIEFAENYEKALKRGVKIRLATEKHVPEKDTIAILGKLMKNPDFEVKFFSQPLPAIVALFDKKEVHVSLSATAQLSDMEGLWSNNSCFVALAEAYFEEKWTNSVALQL